MKQINKIANIVVLAVAGIVLNVVAGIVTNDAPGSITLPIIGCFVLGYFLNKKTKSTLKSATPLTLPSRGLEQAISQGKAYLRNSSRQLQVIPKPKDIKNMCCPTCNSPVSPPDMFCSNCGHKLSLG